jgi:hypothetical protein
MQAETQAGAKTNLNRTLVLIAGCYSSKNAFTSALEYLERAETNMDSDGVKGYALASVKIEIARVHALQGNLHEANSHQQRGIDILVDMNCHKPEYVAEQFQVLAGYQEKEGNIGGQIDSLTRIKVIYQQTFGPCH